MYINISGVVSDQHQVHAIKAITKSSYDQRGTLRTSSSRQSAFPSKANSCSGYIFAKQINYLFFTTSIPLRDSMSKLAVT